MKMRMIDVIKKSSDRDVAQIIGAVVAMRADGLSEEEALNIEYSELLRVLQSEVEVDCKPTNADRIRAMTDEELAEFLMDISMGMLFDKKIMNVKSWLQSEVEESDER